MSEKNVLFVEDNDMCAVLLDGLVAQPLKVDMPDVQTTLVEDADTATALIREKIFHLLVTDLQLPGKQSGLQLMEEARQKQPDIPVIIFTNNKDELAKLPQLVPAGVEVMFKGEKETYLALYRRIKEILTSLSA